MSETQQSETDDALLDTNNSYMIDGEMYLVFRSRLWKRTGKTHNPRVIAQADAVGSRDGGALLTVHADGKSIKLQHHMAGVEERLCADERTDWCYVTFEECDPVFANS